MDIRWISDVVEMKAVSHPLRVRLLGHLREHGPANATELARQFGTDTGSTSYHLRKLAQFGFVTEVADPGSHPRVRRWQAAHKVTSWSNEEFAQTPEGREVSAVMRRRQLEALLRDVERFEAALPAMDPEWIRVSGMSDQLFQLTPGAVAELVDFFQHKVEALAERDAGDPDAKTVAVYVAGYPR